METKHRTLAQAAVMILVLVLLVIGHGNSKTEKSLAQKTIDAKH